MWDKLLDFIIPIIFPKDPNDILHPEGLGTDHWLSADDALPYTIRFENQATAPAQEVTITEKLDSDLDVNSFRLGDFGRGDITIHVPDNTAFYIDRLDLTASKGYLVDVIAGIDVVKGEIFWTLTTIDPKTGEIPLDPTIGFLLTNVEKGTGEGFVNYSIKAKADVTTGTVIDAQATIIFTSQELIDTPKVFNTLDTHLPSSQMKVITTAQATVNTAQFLVQWSASDVGSGLASIGVYVSDNGGAYQLWLDKTTLTQATYAGQRGHSYAFYTVATDQAGNQEAAPATADLTVTVAATAVLADLVAPTLASLNLPTNSQYGLGKNLDFAVHFSEKVFVNIGTTPPKIALTIGSKAVAAQYVSGSGSDTLVFRHVVASGEYDADGVALANVIQLNGGSVLDEAGNPVTSLALSVGSTVGIKVNNAPTVAVAIPDQQAIEDHAFSFTVPANNFKDVDLNDTLVYTATKADGTALPTWLKFDAVNKIFTGTPGNGDVGNINIKCELSA